MSEQIPNAAHILSQWRRILHLQNFCCKNINLIAPLIESSLNKWKLEPVSSRSSSGLATKITSPFELTRFLGWVVACGSLISKLPQVMKIKRQGVSGLSLSMFGWEILGQATAILYHATNGYSPDTYFENASFLLANLTSLSLFYSYTGNRQVLAWMLTPLFLLPLVKIPSVLNLLQSMSIPMYIASRIPQILSNCKSHDVQQLSPVTFAASFIGSCIRIFTTSTRLNNDPVLQVGFAFSCILNAIIVAQIVMYRKSNSSGSHNKARMH